MKDITELINLPNSAVKLDDEMLGKISMDVETGYDIDEKSRESWKKKNDEAVKLAEQVWEQKDWPFKNASNVKYPLIGIGAIQFSARALPNFVKSPDVVKALVVGEDPKGMKAQKAKRVGQHMSYQLLNEMPDWEDDTDKLLTYVPVSGCAFKKTYFSNVLQRNVSEFKRADDVVINYWAKSMDSAPRISDKFTLYPNEIKERVLSGIFLELAYGMPTSTKNEMRESVATDPDQEHVFIEQHGWYDLDGDGYKEPYIFVFHKDTKKIARIVPRYYEEGIKLGNSVGAYTSTTRKITRIEPIHYFTKFSFLPSISGSIYDTGFGHMLEPLNRAINSIINQLIDSGTLYNLNAGFLGKGIQLGRGRGGGRLDFEAGEWKHLNFTGDDLRKHILPLPVKEPSLVLFQLLGFMVTAGERLSSVTEILTGDQSNQAERPTTTLARIEQGLKVFSSIHKRLYRSFKDEYRKIFALNRRYLQPVEYFRILDDPNAMKAYQDDYDYESCDIVPVADPNETTSTEKLIRGQTWMSLQGQGFNDVEIRKRFAEAMQEPEPEKLLNAPAPPPDPKILIEQAKLQLEADKFQFEMLKFASEGDERKAKLMRLVAQAEKDVATAESLEAGPQLEVYKAHLVAITEEMKARYGLDKGRMGTVEGQSNNTGSVSSSQGAAG